MSQRNTSFNYTGEPVTARVGADPTTNRATKANISTTEQVDAQEKRIINGMEFVSIQNEVQRYYDVPTGKGGSTVRVVIKDPQWLFVRSSGSHLVVDAEKQTHYIPNSFVHLVWTKKDGTDAAEF